MFFEKILNLRYTLAFRLALWYAGVFTISSFIAFLLFYLSIASVMQKRTDTGLSSEIYEFASLLSTGGMDAVRKNIDLEAQSNGVDKVFFRVLTPKGTVLASSNMASWPGVGAETAALSHVAISGAQAFTTLSGASMDHKARVVYGSIGPDIFIQIGQSLADDEEILEIIRTTFGITLALLMVAAILIGWFMARRALQGVEEVTRTATEISKGALEMRVPVKARGDEIDRLATTFNSMLDRIHALITGMREMTDNIAHDLRSPITRIRGIAEMVLISEETSGEPAAAADILEECDRLLEMINTMLDITETEAGAGRIIRDVVDLSTVVQDACELFQPLADDKGIALASDVPAGLLVLGDLQRIQRMIANLLDNAIKYTPPRGSVAVAVRDDAKKAVITVSDTGIGVSEKDQTRIFERFYRGDGSRSQRGTGLGLSLARAIASSHGGAITVTSTPGAGSTFTVTLPLLSSSR